MHTRQPVVTLVGINSLSALLTNGSQRSVQELLSILGQYERWLGQVINKQKSTVFCFSKISQSRKRRLLHNTGFVEGHFPFKYLGVPIILDHLKQLHFEDMVNKMRQKLSGWKMRLLSSGGKLILLRHVISRKNR
ncbi:hypothetical protein CIPAW_15G172700 [Carya illinoinensis]|uniref:Uncharacterized protein n=1 Tax=Carya illinoinensis TaxID=32201 RepID=A0A8T1NDZ1_CARIL|nr:hypothetical protein CIPAW_15G172700 [Carya illinoinensis]